MGLFFSSKIKISHRAQCVPYLKKNVNISFSFLLSVVYKGSSSFVFIAHIECPVVGCQFAYVPVCGQLFMSFSSSFFFVSRKKTQEKE